MNTVLAKNSCSSTLHRIFDCLKVQSIVYRTDVGAWDLRYAW